MKFSREDSQTSSQSNISNKNSKRPSVMVNNFVKDIPGQITRPKSVIFSRSSTGYFSNFSTESTQQRDSEGEYSPRSDSSKGSTNNRKQSVVGVDDDLDIGRRGGQLRSLSIGSDVMMEDAVSMKPSWKNFEENIKNIDDTKDYFSQIPKPSFKSSESFQKVMVDLYGNPEYGQKIGYTHLKGKVGNISAMTSKMMARRRAKKDEEKLNMDEVDLVVKEPPSKTTIENAKRGWARIRRHVQEQVSKNKCKASNLKWTMLGQTLRAMSNTEKTRLDLYQRYGLMPKLNNEGQFVTENSMLSERARASLKPTVNLPDVHSSHKSQLRARSSFLPRGLPANTKAYKQRPYYSRQRAVSVGPKAT